MTLNTVTRDLDGEPLRVLYIAGIGRSGSTLLARALGSLDGFVAAGEVMHLFGRGMERNERCACGARFSACGVWGRVGAELEGRGLRAPGRFEAARRELTEGRHVLAPFLGSLPAAARRSIADLRGVLPMVYGSVRRATGCRVIVDSSKSPTYGRVLAGAPGVRVWVLHLVRDSRGVVFSLAKRKERPGVDEADELLDRRSAWSGSALWTGANVLAEKLRADAEGYHRVRYEDFVAAPQRVAREVLSMMDGRQPGKRLEPTGTGRIRLGVHHVLGGNPVRSRTGSVELREDVEWKTRMSKAARWVANALTFPLLSRYGYEIADGAGPRNGSFARPTRVPCPGEAKSPQACRGERLTDPSLG